MSTDDDPDPDPSNSRTRTKDSRGTRFICYNSSIRSLDESQPWDLRPWAPDSAGPLPDYRQRPEPNVDILICTPGGVEDDIRYTNGFALMHLEWLVVEEADRQDERGEMHAYRG